MTYYKYYNIIYIMRKVRYNLFPVEMPSVNASELSQGHAAKIINKIHDNKVDTVVMKNNKPFVVIMEYSEYIKRKGIKNEK